MKIPRSEANTVWRYWKGESELKKKYLKFIAGYLHIKHALAENAEVNSFIQRDNKVEKKAQLKLDNSMGVLY